MGWKFITAIIVLIIGIVTAIGFCAYFFSQSFQGERGEQLPSVWGMSMFIKAIDEKNSYKSIKVYILQNGTPELLDLNKDMWEKTMVMNDNLITPIDEGYLLDEQSCPMQERCILKIRNKGHYSLFYKQEGDIDLALRINCGEGTCERTAVCWIWGKDDLTQALQIRDVRMQEVKPMTLIQPYSYCFEDEFNESVIDFTLHVQYFQLTSNDYVQIEVFDRGFRLNDLVLEKGYVYSADQSDMGMKNLIAKIYPSKKTIIYK